MENPRSAAIWVAVLFIIATAASVAGEIMLGPLRLAGNYDLSEIAENPQKVVSAFLMFLFACSAIVAIPIVLFPILRLHSETGALIYVAARFAEGLLFLFGGIFTLALIPLAFATTEKGDVFAVIDELSLYSYTLGTMVVFGFSAIVLAVLFYQTRLVPRWLSVWKGIGAVLLVAQGVLVLYDSITPLMEQILYLPIAVNEMVLALWLIVKGFSPEALIALRSKADLESAGRKT